MQAAIDRVRLALSLRPALAPDEAGRDELPTTVQDKATAFAGRLLKNYAGYLARRQPGRGERGISGS